MGYRYLFKFVSSFSLENYSKVEMVDNTVGLFLFFWGTSIVLSIIAVPISVQFSYSVVSDSLQPHEPQHTRPPCHHQLPESTQTHVHRVSDANHLILCHPLLLLSSIFPSIRVFSKESALRIMWPKYWSFSFSICPSNEHPGLISFRMDWLDLLAVQGTPKNLQHYSSKASILQHSAFFIVQALHPYMSMEKP